MRCRLHVQIGAKRLAELTAQTGRSIGEVWSKIGGDGAVEKVCALFQIEMLFGNLGPATLASGATVCCIQRC